MIAATRDLNVESAFDLAQVFIKLTAEVCQAVVIGGLEDDVPRNLNRVQSALKTTQQPDSLQAGHGASLARPR